MKESVGIVIIAKNTNNFLLLHRTKNPIVWSLLSGKMDKGEKSPLKTIKREIEEEINISSDKIKDIKKVGVVDTDKKRFHLFVGFVDEEFKPKLKKDENDEYGWFNTTNLPSPMHKRWDKSFQMIKPFLYLDEEIKKILKWITELNGR